MARISFALIALVSFSFLLETNASCEPEFAFPPPALTQDSLKDGLAQLQTTLDALVANGTFDTTSFSVEISSANETIFTSHHKAPVPTNGTTTIDSSTRYRIASNTKLFTALGILQEEAAGKLHLDDSVLLYVPELSQDTNFDWKRITLRSLMSYISGLPDNFAQEDLITTLPDPTAVGLPPLNNTQVARLPKCEAFSKFTTACTFDGFLQNFQNKNPVFPAQLETSYSNVGFDLLGQVLANVTEMKYEDYILSSIVNPLGLNETTFATPDDNTGVIVPGGYWGIELGFGNPSGGIYSSTSDMVRFLRHALATHSNITTTLDWFRPATDSAGRHTQIGYPWEIFRTGVMLPYTKRPVSFVTKGGGLAGYFTYSIILPAYDLVMFLAVAGELPPLNTLFAVVRNSLLARIEQVAQANLNSTYAGQYSVAACSNSSDLCKTNPAGLNSSMTVTQTAEKSMFISGWISNSTDALTNLLAVAGAQSGQGTSSVFFQFMPTFVQRKEAGSSRVGEVWRFINVIDDFCVQETAITTWNDYCVSNIDPIRYGDISVNEAVFWRDSADGPVSAIELPAFQVVMAREGVTSPAR